MKKILALFIVAALTTNASATKFYWLNSDSDNDFANANNWNSSLAGGGSSPTFGDTDDLYIDSFGDDKVVLSSSLGTTPDEIRVGSSSAETGELLISGGTNTLNNNFRVGRGGSTGLLTITGGSLSVPKSFSTFGDGGDATVTMSGGELNIDRSTWAQQIDDTATLNMTGGTINISPSDTSPASSTGSLRTGAGTSTINIGGTAFANIEALNLESSGDVLTLTGGELNLTGSTLNAWDISQGTLPVNAESDIPILQIALGAEFKMEGGVWNLAGDQVSSINGFIGDGYITHSAGSGFINVEYAAGADLTTVTIAAPANGDFDADGDIDGSDFLAWQVGFGTPSGAALSDGDANGDGAVDAADFAIWQDQFGTTAGLGSLASGAVPEPASLSLCLLALAGMCGLLIRRKA